MAELKIMSLNPDTFVRGGLMDNVDVEVTESIFKVWDYDPNDAGGGSGPDTLALKLTMKDMQSGEETYQFWSGGDPSMFTILDENDNPGQDIGVKVASEVKDGFNDSTNVAIFVKSLTNAGFPKDRLDDFKSTLLVGLQMHVVRSPAPTRTGLDQPPAQEGRGKTILTCSSIIKLPWEKAKKGTTKKTGATKKAKGTTKKTAPAAASDEDVNELGKLVVAAVLEANGTVPLGKIKIESLKYMSKNKVAEAPQRNPIAVMVADEEWLLVNGFMVEDETVMSLE